MRFFLYFYSSAIANILKDMDKTSGRRAYPITAPVFNQPMLLARRSQVTRLIRIQFTSALALDNSKGSSYLGIVLLNISDLYWFQPLSGSVIVDESKR